MTSIYIPSGLVPWGVLAAVAMFGLAVASAVAAYLVADQDAYWRHTALAVGLFVAGGIMTMAVYNLRSTVEQYSPGTPRDAMAQTSVLFLVAMGILMGTVGCTAYFCFHRGMHVLAAVALMLFGPVWAVFWGLAEFLGYRSGFGVMAEYGLFLMGAAFMAMVRALRDWHHNRRLPRPSRGADVDYPTMPDAYAPDSGRTPNGR
jgi:hypothetical protein